MAKHAARPFRAIDGESVTIDGEHRYVCLTSSDGDVFEDVAGIATHDALNWLLRVANASPAIMVGFGLNYDANMFLRDVPHERLEELWTEGKVITELNGRTYFLEWIPSKIFAISTEGARCKLYDTFGFFQSSFVNALKSWEIGADDFLKQMKDRRADFEIADLPEIIRYSIHENELLVRLMTELRDALREVGLYPRAWHGAGAIASALLSKHGIDERCAKTYEPGVHRRSSELEEDVLMRAYFGGRTEVFRQGVFAASPIVSWDINSAYPSEALTLPTAAGTWKRTRRYDGAEPWAVWRVKWRMDDDCLVAPFPFRDKRAIYYPLDGEGWYHASEVATAIGVYGDRIEVSSGYVFSPETDELPFAFLQDVYDHRQALKAEGHAGEKVLKLGINSVYGKLAQGSTRDGRRPKFQDYFWSGAITAGTRARAFQAGIDGQDSLVAIATDGIMFAGGEPGTLREAKGLGGWERSEYKDLFVAQPGMYYAHTFAARGVVRHSRGFFTREVKFPTLKRLWIAEGPYGALWCKGSRFIGLGTALLRNDMSVWRTWENPAKKRPENPPRPGWRRLSLYSSRKFYGPDDEGHSIRVLHPPTEVRAGVSDRYIPKYASLEREADQEDFIQGTEQPLRSF